MSAAMISSDTSVLLLRLASTAAWSRTTRMSFCSLATAARNSSKRLVLAASTIA